MFDAQHIEAVARASELASAAHRVVMATTNQNFEDAVDEVVKTILLAGAALDQLLQNVRNSRITPNNERSGGTAVTPWTRAEWDRLARPLAEKYDQPYQALSQLADLLVSDGLLVWDEAAGGSGRGVGHPGEGSTPSRRHLNDEGPPDDSMREIPRGSFPWSHDRTDERGR